MGNFATVSPSLHTAGMAVLPISIADKDPLVSGFNKWKRRPGRISLDKWREKFPDANCGYVPALTGKGIIVIDDDGGAGDKIVELFGKTPGMVQTRRGNHYQYRAPAGLERFNLKKLGINADVKMGNDIVVGPGSVHESGHLYGWNGCDERVLGDLPMLDMRGLGDLLKSGRSQEAIKQAEGMRGASRELALNDYLLRHAMSVENIDELIDIAMTWNEDLPRRGLDLMTGTEVMKMVRGVWKDREKGKLECWHGRRATVKVAMTDFDKLAGFGKDGTTLAFPMLMKLRAEHGARTSRGQTFALNQLAMVRAQTMPGWTRYDYEKARAILLESGFVVQVSEFKMTSTGRQGAQFKLT